MTSYCLKMAVLLFLPATAEKLKLDDVPCNCPRFLEHVILRQQDEADQTKN